MKYDYLFTDNWKNLRKSLIWDNPNSKCASCKYKQDKSKLHLHHKNYDFVYRETKADVIILCDKCHKFLEDYRKKFGGEKMPFWYLQKMGKKIGRYKTL